MRGRFSERRDWLEVTFCILDACKKEEIASHIERGCGLNHNLLRRYIDDLMRKGFLKERVVDVTRRVILGRIVLAKKKSRSKTLYSLTSKGKELRCRIERLLELVE